jgi:exodeoxyribonuclease V beta subunit
MNPLEIPLKGLGLIEASAGTGKTYTITALYLRLLLEQSLTVEQILVVTYTKAATAELKERIRKRMVEVRAALQSGASEDSLIQNMLDEIENREQAERQLNYAILSFDKAAIYTIHGFCQRALIDHAFESKQPFERELEPDQSALIQEITHDFWRREICDASATFTRYLISCNTTPATLLKPIGNTLDKPQLKVCTAPVAMPLAQIEADAQASWLLLQEMWQQESSEIMELLQQAPLSKVSYKPAQMEQWQSAMTVQLQSEQLPSKLFDKFENFTSSKLAKSTKKGQQPPEHPFFTACDQFLQQLQHIQQAYNHQLLALHGALRNHLLEELPKRKKERHLQTYDDLLTDLLSALQQPENNLTNALQLRYQAALIDEFQDTDAVQYQIFSSIYSDSDHPLIFVGDPKQAIYGFRGADIFAYLEARNAAQDIHTLDTNWRSVPGLINSVNHLFSTPQSFLLSGIHYHDVQAADKAGDQLNEPSGDCEPFRFRLIESGDKPLTKDVASEMAAIDTAEQIARLLNLGQSGEVTIGEHSLTGGDIAVLVRSHKQAELISSKLLQHGIFSVQSSQASVYESPQAVELERVLLAIAEPSREPLIKAALATDLFGFDASALALLNQDEAALNQQIEQFNGYHKLWRERGFTTLFRQLLSQRAVAQRLLTFADGERRLTNLLHLGELIQQQEQSHQPGMCGLTNWLSQQRREPPRQHEASQLRLESDENLVQILTIHKSKGLEFPVLFCPFLWDGRLHNQDKKNSTFTFHAADSGEAQLELGSEEIETHRSLAIAEEMAENLRLLYVALTRAKYRCYISWGNIKSAEYSAMSWLLHPPADPAQSNAINQMASAFKKLGHAGIELRLKNLAVELAGDLRVDSASNEGASRYRDDKREGKQLTARAFKQLITSNRRLTSFSALAAGVESDLPDYDAHTSRGTNQQQPQQANGFTFPRGARAGSALHDMFEHHNFTQQAEEPLAELATTTLQRYGFSDEWQPIACQMVNQTLDTALDKTTSIKLRELPNQQRLNELEFCFPLSSLSGKALQQLLIEHQFAQHEAIAQAIQHLNFKQIRGFLKGFVDLIFEADGRFYLVDYKSNWLGNQYEDYGSDAMTEAMAEHSYYLQYLLYVVALHRYLGERLADYHYESHFGEVYYLFIRGMSPGSSETGIYRDRPSLALVEALDQLFREGRS